MSSVCCCQPKLPAMDLPVDMKFKESVVEKNSQVGGPVPQQARQGRQLQRYSAAGERLVAGCIPFKLLNSCGGQLADVRVLLVSSRGGKAWSFPKGGWETDEPVDDAARRETVEESGARGVLEEPLVGEFPFVSGKALRLNRGEGRCRAFVYAMLVEEELENWPEQGQRQRQWFTLAEAVTVLKSDWMRDALLAWVARRGWDTQTLIPAQQTENVQLNGTAHGMPR